MATERDLLQTLIHLLNSDAARKVEVSFDGVYFTGGFFTLVTSALIGKWQGIGGRALFLMRSNVAEAFYRSKKTGAAAGTGVGFAVSDMPLSGVEWGYKSFAAFLDDHGRSASGDARIRWGQGEGYCGGQVVSWTSHAV